jgi:Ca2+-binding RTX toxin-like protein
MSSPTEEDAVLQTTLAVYDALFSDLGPEARSSFEATVSTYMSDPDIPEVESLASSVAYTNWNYHLVNGLKSKIAGSSLVDEDEDQAAQIASFVAQDLRIAGKLAAIVESTYEVNSNNNLYQLKIAEVKQLYDTAITNINIELDSLNSRLDTVNTGDIGLYVYEANPALKLSKDIATQNELLAEAQNLRSQLDGFEVDTLGSKGSGAEEFTKAYAEFSQLRIDTLELKKVDLLIQLEKHSVVQDGDAVSPYIDAIQNDISNNAQQTLDISDSRDRQTDFSNNTTTDLKAAGISVAGNVLYAVQAGVGFATKGEDAPVSSYVASSGFLGEALLGGFGDILEATGHAKVANGFKGAASVALLAGNAASFAPIAQILATGKGADGNDLSAEQLSVIRAEVGLQGTSLALSAVETTLNIALLAVNAGSKAASVLGTAIPIIGAIGSIVGAINPLKWAEFGQKQERIDAIRDSDTYSSGLLGDVLSESKTIEAGFYGATTAINVVTGVGSAALAVTGFGAPIAAAVGLIGGAISAIVGAFEQVALEVVADNYANKIRTDEDGNEQSVEDYFEGSLDEKQEQTKEHYQEFFTELVANDGIDQVVALGGQGLDVTDIELSAITKTSGELNKTAQNYVETFTDNGWQERTQELSQSAGDNADVIQLQNAHGAKTYLTFTTPLFAAGNEETSRESTGKNAYQTTLKITDLSGWTIRDYGDNETTFNLSKLVTSAENLEGQKKDIRFNVEAGGGNDTLFSYEAGVTFDGGAGKDTASYARLSDTDLTSGLNISLLQTGSGQPQAIAVHKNLASGGKTYQESIETQTINYGKRTEVVEYRAISLVERDSESTSTDVLYGIEILHGSSLGDSIDVAASTEIQQVFGFGGDDVIRVGDTIEVVSGGAGNDEITVNHSVLTQVFHGERELYIDGGEGQFDTLALSSATFDEVLDEHESQLIREQLAHDTTESLLPAETLNREAEFEATYQSLVNILRNNDPDALKQVALFNTEYIKVDLIDAGTSTQNTAHSLTDYREALNEVFLNVDTTANTSGEVNIFASAAKNQTSVSLLGSDYNDFLEGSNYNDYLFGGEGSDVFYDSNGNDILVGGSGQDVYSYDNYRSVASSSYSGHDIITGPLGEDIKGDIITISADLSANTFFYRYADDLVVGLSSNRSVTVANYYSSELSLTNSDLRKTNLTQEELSSLQVSSNEFVINFENDGSGTSGNISFYATDNSYRANFKSSYTTFRENDGFEVLQTPSSDFSTQLGLLFEDERGGATVGVSELDALLALSNITSASRTTIEGTGDYNVWGDSNSNLIIGNSYSIEDISAGDGDDLVIGGGGYHIIDGGDGVDIASYQDATYGIKSDLTGEQSTKGEFNGDYYRLDTLSNIEGIIATSSDDILIGNDANNYLEGRNGTDTISGNGGNDIIHGGNGLDILDGGTGFDIASYQGASYAIKFDLSGDQTEFYKYNGNYLVGDQVSNFEGVIGTSFSDVLIGNDADNYLAGGANADTISGGSGHDIIHGGNGLDNLDGGAGFDIASYEGANYAIKFDLRGDQQEHYLHNGTYYSGDSVSNFEGVIGSSLDDIFIGNDENNYFVGGAGNDVFTGGAGADQFVFKAGSGHDVIEDYLVGTDQLSIDTVLIDSLSFDQVGDDVRVDLGEDNSITLQGVNLNQFVVEDYLFS